LRHSKKAYHCESKAQTRVFSLSFSFSLFFLSVMCTFVYCLSVCKIYLYVGMQFWSYVICVIFMRVCIIPFVYICPDITWIYVNVLVYVMMNCVGWEHTRTHMCTYDLAIYDYLYSTRYSIVSSSSHNLRSSFSLYYFISSLFLYSFLIPELLLVYATSTTSTTTISYPSVFFFFLRYTYPK